MKLMITIFILQFSSNCINSSINSRVFVDYSVKTIIITQ